MTDVGNNDAQYWFIGKHAVRRRTPSVLTPRASDNVALNVHQTGTTRRSSSDQQTRRDKTKQRADKPAGRCNRSVVARRRPWSLVDSGHGSLECCGMGRGGQLVGDGSSESRSLIEPGVSCRMSLSGQSPTGVRLFTLSGRLPMVTRDVDALSGADCVGSIQFVFYFRLLFDGSAGGDVGNDVVKHESRSSSSSSFECSRIYKVRHAFVS